MLVELAAVVLAGAIVQTDDPNTLTPAERAAGWRLLFDGNSLDQWRGYRQEGLPAQGWVVEDGAMHHRAGGGGGDLVTRQQFGEFELRFEFRVAPNANSGVMFGVQEVHAAPWQTGPEFQVLDDAGHGLAADHPHSVGSLYELYSASAEKPVRPAGEWNQGRIRHAGGRVQHFLNGVKIVDGDASGEEWAARIEASKFKVYEGFGVQARGHIALQDHGDDVWYRGLKIRELGEPSRDEVALFNGRDFEGWTFHLGEPGDPADTWSVRDGVVVCTGTPAGYMRTVESYGDYVLRLRWRFAQAGNSGVLCRIHGEDRVWPKSVEPQLMVGRAGDFHAIGIDPITPAWGDPARQQGGRIARALDAERGVGEWNEYEIIADGDRITLYINGELVNEAVGCPTIAGPIGLQSEGVEIHFKDIRLTPIR